MDILTILETSAAEIRSLRERVESDKVMRANQTLRIAISQMRGNRIEYKDADGAEWDALNALIDDGRVGMDHAGEVLLDMKVLTKELLHAEMTNDLSKESK